MLKQNFLKSFEELSPKKQKLTTFVQLTGNQQDWPE